MGIRGKQRHLLVLIAAALVASVGYYHYFGSQTEIGEPVVPSQWGGTPSPQELQNEIETEMEDLVAKDETSISSIEPSSQQSPVAQFVRTRSRGLNGSGVDTEGERLFLQSQVNQWSQDQLMELVTLATSDSHTANEKIFATYLLTLSSVSSEAIGQLAAAPLKVRPPEREHDINETLGVQEKSLRIMAIDELTRRAKSSPLAKEELRKLTKGLADPTLRAYAEKKYRQLES